MAWGGSDSAMRWHEGWEGVQGLPSGSPEVLERGTESPGIS